VKSASYFEQMKGRGARTIPDADFQAVTPDAATKTRFVLVDAIGVTEHDYVDPVPLDRAPSVSLKKLLDRAAMHALTEDEAASLASRLAKLHLQLTPAERNELDTVAGQPVQQIVEGLVEAVDVDRQAAALAEAQAFDPDATLGDVVAVLVEEAAAPLADNPELRARILELRQAHDVLIDELSGDRLLRAGGVVDTDRARSVVESWAEYLREHRDEITLVQLTQDSPAGAKVTFRELKDLADRIHRPPRQWTPDLLWAAYEALDSSRVRHADRHTVADLVSLVRYTLGVDMELVPYAHGVRHRYQTWLAQQQQAGITFTERQRWWLDRIADAIATSASVTWDDLDAPPFTERGGIDGLAADLGPEAETVLTQLRLALPA
jgi:type I restriction enzyme R subunit